MAGEGPPQPPPESAAASSGLPSGGSEAPGSVTGQPILPENVAFQAGDPPNALRGSNEAEQGRSGGMWLQQYMLWEILVLMESLRDQDKVQVKHELENVRLNLKNLSGWPQLLKGFMKA